MLYVGFWSFCTNADWFLEEAIYRNWLASLSSATPLPLSPVNSEAMPRDDQDWSAKGDILRICYHIWEGKCGLIASNVDKASVLCGWFCWPEVSRLGTTSL